MDMRVRRCPPLVLARLIDELREYLVERSVAGGEGKAISFYHRQVVCCCHPSPNQVLFVYGSIPLFAAL